MEKLNALRDDMTRMPAVGLSISLSSYQAAVPRNAHATPTVASSHKLILDIRSQRQCGVGVERWIVYAFKCKRFRKTRHRVTFGIQL
jgi:hypothetical protein